MATAAQARSAGTILVIDDDPNILNMSARVLRKEGFQVLVAADTPEALRLSEDHASSIDLLLTDVILPSGNGMAAARAFLAKRPNTPVLYMSGFHADAIQAVQAEGGPNGGFIEKPFLPHVLIDRVRGSLPASAHRAPEAVREVKEIKDVREVREVREVTEAPPDPASASTRSEAMYQLESPVRCPHCGDTISALKAVRLLRTQVNFTSTLPRRGRLVTCPSCLAPLPAELTNF